jgi:dolichol-phosphate mannosyltransferase
MKNKLGVVVPCYGAPSVLDELVTRLKISLKDLVAEDFVIVLVCDGCPFGSWDVIAQLCNQTENVVGINLSRNFGQHAAISAGLHSIQCKHVVVMDCDLQDSPEEISKLYKKALQGFDVVFGKRVKRQDSWIKKAGSVLFYKVYNFLTGFETDASIANFSVISDKVAQSYKLLGEQHRPYSYFINWLGFKRYDVEIKHSKRAEGKSSYTLNKLLNLALSSVVSETNRPLKLAIKMGFFFSFSALIFAVYLIYKWAMGGVVQGWTSVMVTIVFATGVILANLGLVGIYIGKIFDETKRRPVYVISDIVQKDK